MKAEPSRLERYTQGFAKIPRRCGTTCKNKQEWIEANRDSIGRRHTGVASAPPTDRNKGPTEKQKIINATCKIDASTVEKNMPERMTLDKP